MYALDRACAASSSRHPPSSKIASETESAFGDRLKSFFDSIGRPRPWLVRSTHAVASIPTVRGQNREPRRDTSNCGRYAERCPTSSWANTDRAGAASSMSICVRFWRWCRSGLGGATDIAVLGWYTDHCVPCVADLIFSIKCLRSNRLVALSPPCVAKPSEGLEQSTCYRLDIGCSGSLSALK